MNWFRRWLRRAPVLTPEEGVAISKYREASPPLSAHVIHDTRFVVLDVETSGLDPYRDRLLSIGAVTVHDGTVALSDAFEVVLRQDVASDPPNILVHGIGGSMQLSGREARVALLEFIAYAGRAPLVGYHVDFDRVMIVRALQGAFGIQPLNDWLDLARILPALFPHLARRGRGLDFWLSQFSIDNFSRHDAMADALATAQLLQVALPQGRVAGLTTYGDLKRLEKNQRWLERTQPR